MWVYASNGGIDDRVFGQSLDRRAGADGHGGVDENAAGLVLSDIVAHGFDEIWDAARSVESDVHPFEGVLAHNDMSLGGVVNGDAPSLAERLVEGLADFTVADENVGHASFLRQPLSHRPSSSPINLSSLMPSCSVYAPLSMASPTCRTCRTWYLQMAL